MGSGSFTTQRKSVVKSENRPTTKLIPERKKAGPSDIGLTAKQIHEARAVRDAEKNDPAVERPDAFVRAHVPTPLLAIGRVVLSA
jgi:hypothetical protein